jgi:hypothetical protein
MPLILRSFRNGYNYGDSLKNESKKLEKIVKQNFINKDKQLINEEKFLEGGIKHSIKKFDQKIKKKIRNF